MQANHKDVKARLEKLGIEALNPMQLQSKEAIRNNDQVVLVSETGSGKTLAFLLPLIDELDPSVRAIQLMILVPSRELAIQIEQVVRTMGTGYKTNAVYGGRAGAKDKIELKHPPAILIGTPGRVADHMRRGNFETTHIRMLVLDEFDKILEVGFSREMGEIINKLPVLRKKVLTSATQNIKYPDFINLQNPVQLNFTKKKTKRLQIKTVETERHNQLDSLVELLQSLPDQSGIVFCNFKDSIDYVSQYLDEQDVDHACFYGGLEQQDRERALLKFRNGTHRILLATDLAARGIDVPEMDFIIHYELPMKLEEFTHRNGRTARMHAEGTAYVMKWKNKDLPDFISADEEFNIPTLKKKSTPKSVTLFISGGRKDKISKGDIAGLFMKQGQLGKDELGLIELKQDCAFVAVPKTKSAHLIKILNNSRLKKKKVRISLLE